MHAADLQPAKVLIWYLAGISLVADSQGNNCLLEPRVRSHIEEAECFAQQPWAPFFLPSEWDLHRLKPLASTFQQAHKRGGAQTLQQSSSAVISKMTIVYPVQCAGGLLSQTCVAAANKGIGWAIAANLAAQGIRTVVSARDVEVDFISQEARLTMLVYIGIIAIH